MKDSTPMLIDTNGNVLRMKTKLFLSVRQDCLATQISNYYISHTIGKVTNLKDEYIARWQDLIVH